MAKVPVGSGSFSPDFGHFLERRREGEKEKWNGGAARHKL